MSNKIFLRGLFATLLVGLSASSGMAATDSSPVATYCYSFGCRPAASQPVDPPWTCECPVKDDYGLETSLECDTSGLYPKNPPISPPASIVCKPTINGDKATVYLHCGPIDAPGYWIMYTKKDAPHRVFTGCFKPNSSK